MTKEEVTRVPVTMSARLRYTPSARWGYRAGDEADLQHLEYLIQHAVDSYMRMHLHLRARRSELMQTSSELSLVTTITFWVICVWNA